MTLISDVARRSSARLIAVAGLGAVLAAAAGAWACWPVALPVPAALAAVPAAAASREAAIAGAQWDVRLWQPLSDAPVVAASQPAPLKLFSILKRDGVFIAALSASDGDPLIYAKSGEVVQGVTIRQVDATGVDLHSALGDQRLDLGR